MSPDGKYVTQQSRQPFCMLSINAFVRLLTLFSVRFLCSLKKQINVILALVNLCRFVYLRMLNHVRDMILVTCVRKLRYRLFIILDMGTCTTWQRSFDFVLCSFQKSQKRWHTKSFKSVTQHAKCCSKCCAIHTPSHGFMFQKLHTLVHKISTCTLYKQSQSQKSVQ